MILGILELLELIQGKSFGFGKRAEAARAELTIPANPRGTCGTIPYLFRARIVQRQSANVADGGLPFFRHE
jgi:hypothetical protein